MPSKMNITIELATLLLISLLLAQPVSGRRTWLGLREAEIPFGFGEGTEGDTEDPVRRVALEDPASSGTGVEEPTLRTLTIDTCDATHKVLADDGEALDWFGHSSDIDGDYLIVGAPWDTIDGVWSGSAYVLRRGDDGGWSQQTKLVANQPTEDDWFGYSVAISNDVALVGSYGSGKVEVFVLQDGTTDDWSREATLEGIDYTFGQSLDIDDIDGNTAIVGEPYANNHQGKAYIYVRDDETREWSEPQVIEANDGEVGDWFGYSVAVRGDTAIVGAHRDDNNKGSAYVLVRDEADNTWKEQAKLTASDGTVGDDFGRSVAVQDNVAIVGATGTQSGGTVYAFVRGRDGWEERSSVTGQEFGAASEFGYDLALEGDRLVIGAGEIPSGDGKAYLVDVDAEGKLSLDRELVAQGLAAGAEFGSSVGISDGTIVVGAPGDTDDNNTQVGSTYIFDNCVTDVEEDEGGDGSNMAGGGRYVRRE